MKRFDDEDDPATLSHLARSVEMCQEEFLQHYNEADFFHTYYEDAMTYGAAREELRQRDNAKLRHQTIQKLKVMMPKFKKRPSLKFISQVGQKFMGENRSPWSDCRCKTTWAKQIRDLLWNRPSKGRGSKKKTQLQPMITWIRETLAKTGKVENKDAKSKYQEIFGVVTSQSVWSKASKRLRTQMKLSISSEVVQEDGKKKQRFWWHI